MPPTPPKTSQSRIASLDGLRGVAILLVFIWHFSQFTHSFFPGWAGVDLFFVLSGYLITQRLQSTRNSPGYLSQFYRNRVLRIFPLYYAFVIGFLLLTRFFISPQHLPTLEGYLVHWKSFLLFTENWTFVRYPIPTDLSLVPLWSVAVEIQFYLIWPFLMLLTPSTSFRLKAFPILLAVIIGTRIAFFLAFPLSRHSIYYNSFFRMDGLLTGSLLFQLHDTQKKLNDKWVIATLLGIFAILLTAGIVTEDARPFNPFFPLIGFTLLALFFAGILHLALQPSNRLSFLRNRFLQGCGRISYCLYIVQVPLLNVLYPRFGALGSTVWPGHPALFHLLAILTTLILSFLISIFSYHYFESYFLRLKR